MPAISQTSHAGLLPRAGTHSYLKGLWRLADPKIALASLVPFCVGAALAWRGTHSLDAVLALAAFMAIFLVEVGKNAVNDLYDFRSGADTALRPEELSPYSGGKRVLVDRLLTESDLVGIAAASFAIAAVIGTVVALETTPLLFLLGAAAAVVSVLYAMPPVHLSYRGLGELAVFAVYGPGVVFGSILLFGGALTGEAVVAAVTLGILIAAVLLANEIPDARADAVAGKRTLVVRLGREQAVSAITVLFGLAYLIPLMRAGYGAETWIAAAAAGAPVAAFASWELRHRVAGPPVLAQSATLLTYVVTGVALAVAAMLG